MVTESNCRQEQKLNRLVTCILMSKAWKLLVESNSNLEDDKTVLKINKKTNNVKLKIKYISPFHVFRHFIRLPSRRMALVSTQPLVKMSTRNILAVKAAGA